MSDFVPLSKDKHKGFGWLQTQNYNFAAQDTTVPLVVDEIGKAMLTLPLVFRRKNVSSATIGYELVALLSPLAKRNLHVKPDGGWLSDYIPAYLQAYPFRLLPAADTGQQILCFDKASGLMTEADAANSKPFFAANGQPSPVFAGVIQLLTRYEQRRVQTQAAVDNLAALGLIIPWDIVLTTTTGKKVPVEGVFKVDAAALQKLAADSLHKLHQSGALPIVYAQLFSEQHVQNFGELLRVYGELNKKSNESVTLGHIEALFGSKSDILNLDHF